MAFDYDPLSVSAEREHAEDALTDLARIVEHFRSEEFYSKVVALIKAEAASVAKLTFVAEEAALEAVKEYLREDVAGWAAVAAEAL